MAAKRKKTSSFRMLATPDTKEMLIRQADKADMSAADYIAALIAADASGRVVWGLKNKKTRVTARV